MILVIVTLYWVNITSIQANQLEIVPSSNITGTSICKSGFEIPQCIAIPFNIDGNVAFQNNSIAKAAVAKDNILDYDSIHKPEYANDGFYGNGSSWISNSDNSWIKIDLGRNILIHKVKFGRDRTGNFDDRDLGAFSISIATNDNIYVNENDTNDEFEYTEIFSSTSDFSGMINGSETLQVSFPAVIARYVKLIVSNTGTAIDEIEVLAACQLYGVHDKGLNNSQFFTVSPETFEVKALGEIKKAHDVEALDIHPQTAELFAASGKDTNAKGHLYQLNGQTGELTSIGSTGFKEIDGLSFHPDGTLWGWATGDGLVTIDTVTGKASLIAAYSGEVEDLTWNTSGTMLFGVENMQDNPDAGVRLLAYDGNTVSTICEELTQSLEIEALDTLPDDTLIFGLHGKNSLPLGVIDVQTCKIVAEQEISTSYNDVEGIAWPNCQQ